MPHPLLSMKIYETFRKSKFDPCLYSLNFYAILIRIIRVIEGLRVGSYCWTTLYHVTNDLNITR